MPDNPGQADQQGPHVEPQLGPEPLPHQAVDVEVEAGVEDNEDIVEVSYTEPESWDRIFPSQSAVRHPAVRNY